jgi:hypothetical protein
MKKIFPSSQLLCFSFLLFLFSCSSETVKAPAGILPKDKMIDVLVDVHIAESSTESRGLTATQVNSLVLAKYEEVMKKHGTTMEAFKASFTYYEHHPDVFDEIYQEVVNRLTALEGKARARKATPKKEGVDSLPPANE